MESRAFDHIFKIVIVGDSGVGKSCLLLRFADDTFNESYICTIGVDFRFRTFTVDGKQVKLQIWDTAGQERYRTITNAYYRGANGVILVFDKTDQKSFENIESWRSEVEKYSDNAIKIMVGNKSDQEENFEVTLAQAEQKSAALGIPYVEASAFSGKNVETIFETISRLLIENNEKMRQRTNLKLNTNAVRKLDKCCRQT